MKKFNHRYLILILIVTVVVALVATYVIIRVGAPEKCHDIIGDGYAMGTDPEPVVIGNTCD